MDISNTETNYQYNISTINENKVEDEKAKLSNNVNKDSKYN